MSENYITTFFSNQGSRNEVRMRVVNKLALEEPGKGREELASRYTYYVETLEDEKRIYLRRPANLHNGFDFLVCIEGYNFSSEGKRKRNYPKHDDIIEDLKNKKSLASDEYTKLYRLIKEIYECNDVDENTMKIPKFQCGFSCEMILKTLKWLFIEQDIRYWNYSGRDMLWNGIPTI